MVFNDTDAETLWLIAGAPEELSFSAPESPDCRWSTRRTRRSYRRAEPPLEKWPLASSERDCLIALPYSIFASCREWGTAGAFLFTLRTLAPLWLTVGARLSIQLLPDGKSLQDGSHC